jgi:hypothetical protein
MSSAGYGQVSFSNLNRDNFDEDDDDVYSQPVSVEGQSSMTNNNYIHAFKLFVDSIFIQTVNQKMCI